MVRSNLLGTRIRDLSPLAESPIRTLWLTGCPVEDLTPLRRVPLISLTLHDTRVSDLSPLANLPLERLHIGGSQVTDLTPLGSLQLTRLIFTPGRIKREMVRIGGMDASFHGRGDVAVMEVTPSDFPPVRYKGHVCVRRGP